MKLTVNPLEMQLNHYKILKQNDVDLTVESFRKSENQYTKKFIPS